MRNIGLLEVPVPDPGRRDAGAQDVAGRGRGREASGRGARAGLGDRGRRGGRPFRHGLFAPHRVSPLRHKRHLIEAAGGVALYGASASAFDNRRPESDGAASDEWGGIASTLLTASISAAAVYGFWRNPASPLPVNRWITSTSL